MSMRVSQIEYDFIAKVKRPEGNVVDVHGALVAVSDNAALEQACRLFHNYHAAMGVVQSVHVSRKGHASSLSRYFSEAAFHAGAPAPAPALPPPAPRFKLTEAEHFTVVTDLLYPVSTPLVCTYKEKFGNE